MAEANNLNKRFLTYNSHQRTYGISTTYVIEIINNHTITSLPMAPNYVKGIINLRGQIIPIIDIGLQMGKPALVQNNNTCIIILDISNISLGILVDSVSQVIDLDHSKITPIPIKDREELVNGMIQLQNNEIILLLDCEQLVR